MVEQVIFTFRQKKKLYWFKMFDYIKPTADTVVDELKTYYTNVTTYAGTLQCTGEIVTDPVENPAEAGYYEVVAIEAENDKLPFIINSHFRYLVTDGGFSYISFIFAPKETAQFAPTIPEANVQFEVMLRIDADKTDNSDEYDSTIIEKQPQIIVKDSLYSQVALDGGGLYASEDPERLASAKLTVRG